MNPEGVVSQAIVAVICIIFVLNFKVGSMRSSLILQEQIKTEQSGTSFDWPSLFRAARQKQSSAQDLMDRGERSRDPNMDRYRGQFDHFMRQDAQERGARLLKLMVVHLSETVTFD